MPTVPVIAAGWRIDPPVSVAVAPSTKSAATAEDEPPEEPPGTNADVGTPAPPGVDDRSEATGLVRRTHGELIVVELAQHHGAGVPKILRDGRFVGGREALENVGAGRRAHTLGADKVLDAERQPFERPRIALGMRASLILAGQGLIRRRQHVGIERLVAGGNGLEKRRGQFRGREPLGGKTVAGFEQGQSGEVAHARWSRLGRRLGPSSWPIVLASNTE